MRTANKLRPRTKPPEERRDELTKAAKRLFLEQGVGSTTIDHIATAADVAKGTVYLHFESKQALLAALGERFAEKHLACIKSALAVKSEQDWAGRLAAWAEASVTFYLDSITLHDMLFHEARAPTREGLVDNLVIDAEAHRTRVAVGQDRPRPCAVCRKDLGRNSIKLRGG